MGLLDSATGALSELGNSALSTASSLFASTGADTARFYKVFILADRTAAGQEPIRIVADCPQEFTFSTAVNYDAPFQDMLSSKLDEKLSGASQTLGAFGVRLFNQAMTCKVWTGASDTVINIPLIFQVEDSADVDVLLPIMQLMFLSMAGEKKRGDFLTAPGPSFDWKKVSQQVGAYQAKLKGLISNVSIDSASTAASNSASSFKTDLFSSSLIDGISNAFTTGINGANSVSGAVNSALMGAVSNRISLQIGNSLFLKDVVIENVSQTQVMSPVGDLGYGQSSGINSLVRVDVTFKTFYTLTQQDLAEMLLPIDSGGAPKTKEALDYLLGTKSSNANFLASERANRNSTGTVDQMGPPEAVDIGGLTFSGG